MEVNIGKSIHNNHCNVKSSTDIVSQILISITVVMYFAYSSCCNTILAALDGVIQLGKANFILQI